GLLAMPRVFAHAHLGALDTFIAFFWTLALLASARALDAKRPSLAMAGAGILWGLALLTKIHAWFLPPILLIWALARYRKLWVLPPFLAWSATGIATFALGWPWLWYHTGERLAAYWGTGVERTSIFVQYFGQVYADRDIPWHYPWFYFAATVPVGLHALGLLGLSQSWRERRTDPALLLPAGSIVFFLTLFSTRVPVYDGERLFLMVFPLWALLIGRGFHSAWQWTSSRRIARIGLLGFFVAQGAGTLTVHPFGLSYYNALVGGLRGAERLGLELTYWNDAVDPTLLARLAAEA
ncbi:4-amino-4-deoxy-L-arabinose transferase, partial [Singulisphaera rosea]